MTDITLVHADARYLPLADASVHMVCTSPPYWGLRDYHVDGQLGAEPLHDCMAWTRGEEPCDACYLCHMRSVFAEAWRVLHPSGTLWLNMGDTYASAWSCSRRNIVGNGSLPNGKREARPQRMGGALKEKDLCGIPWRLALALQNDGWWLRSDIVWQKPNPMPESVTDRPARAHEYVFLLTKSEQYFYDAEALREPHKEGSVARRERSRTGGKYRNEHGGQPFGNPHSISLGLEQCLHPAGRNARSVWSIATTPFAGAHFACMPPELARRCILAGSSAHGVCSACGAPWERLVSRQRLLDGTIPVTGAFCRPEDPFRIPPNGNGHWRYSTQTTDHSWQPSCRCQAPVMRARVLDPFAGSGTTGLVARELGRDAVLCDLSFPYLRDVARERLGLTALAAWQQGEPPRTVRYDDLPLFVLEAP